ncbi:MAG: glycosyl hydrolase 53 family protein [Muribaculaceae bacterium]|nr:glycosyl hydrolase 53 family protein [Muribaculaceae bacterium]
MNRIISLAVGSLLALNLLAQDKTEPFWLGADISGTPEQEAQGIVNYNDLKQPMENTSLMKYYGLNAIRLKVWVNSENDFNTPRHVLEMARRAQMQGMEVMVDFHYSDTWADPGHNNSPKEWLGLELIDVKGKLAEHTRSTLQLLKDNGINVKWVQVGNETTNGMVWPYARIPDHMEAYVELSNAGYDAVKEVYPEAIVITHLDDGYNRFLYTYVLNAMKRLGGKFDAIGMSVYPYWSHRDQTTKEAVTDIIDNINALAEEFKCKVYIVETGTAVWTPDESYDFLSRLITAAMDDTHGNCPGVFYWEPTTAHSPQIQGYGLGAFESFMPTKIMDAYREAAARNK